MIIHVCFPPKKKIVKPNRCFKRQLIVISNQNIWKSKLLNFNLLIVLHFLSNKYNKGYDYESMNSNVLFSHFPDHHYLAIQIFVCSVKLFSLEGHWTPQVINLINKDNIQLWESISDAKRWGASLSQSAGLNFNEAKRNHVQQQFYGATGLSNQHKNLRLHVFSCQHELRLFNDISVS